MKINKTMEQRLANYTSFETRTQSARQRLGELANDPDHKSDPGFIRDFLNARARFRDEAKSCDTTKASIIALDRYGRALTALEQHLEELFLDRVGPETPDRLPG